ncbi:hypothetical protein [Acidipila rosea]|uniref:Uncharacterized protein n=1 Tax=Acidipila rosea TaxID=768535 RepID=A0A4R1L7G2_9BACT|nr:hypothetical protein [Acidipila rosea]TCK74134.1 hypothetical protein C7378_1756 [Acidipila rosea]
MDRRSFPDSWKRLDRAVFHLKAFQAEWERICSPDAYEFVTEPDSDWTFGATRAVAKFSRENTLALELGEFFYNLRSALDSTIYQAAVFLKYPDPPIKADTLEFPICSTEDRFKRVSIDKRDFPNELVAWIKSIQPYNIPNTTDLGMRDFMTHLLLIHDCARKDRHRLPHVVAAFPTELDFRYLPTPETITIRGIKRVRVNFLESDEPFLFFEIRGADLTQHCKVKFETALQLEVFIDEIPIPPGGRFDIEIKAMCAAVEYVISWFESRFKV